MKICESYAELQTYKWSIIRDNVLKELLEKLPTVKPVASTVSWSDELQQVGELCQNTTEESEGNTVETSQQHSSRKIHHKVTQIQAQQQLKKCLLWGIPTAQRFLQPKQTQNSLLSMKNLVNSMNRSWCI